MKVNGASELYSSHSSKYLALCSTEQYTGLKQLGSVNYDRIFIFGWTIPLKRYETWDLSSQHAHVISSLTLGNIMSQFRLIVLKRANQSHKSPLNYHYFMQLIKLFRETPQIGCWRRKPKRSFPLIMG